jgi:purine-binding chemotaxis protein CheW
LPFVARCAKIAASAVFGGDADRQAMSAPLHAQVRSGPLAQTETRTGALVCRMRSRFCAIPLVHVIETMRPLRVEPLGATLPSVNGIAIIRGLPVPVVDLGALLGTDEPPDPTRFVTLAVDGRSVALAVEGVVGIRELSAEAFDDLPPLFRDASAEVISAVGVLDASLLVVLRATRILPDSTWNAVLAVQGSQ